MKKYYIYHIKGKKIGVSTNPNLRVKNQGYNNFEILETHSDIHIVSYREIELQKQYGYRVDRLPYYLSSQRTKPISLTTEQQEYIHSHYFRANNQFTKIPNGKFNIAQLANKFNVTKKIVTGCLKRGISRM